MSILCCSSFRKFTMCDYYNLSRIINYVEFYISKTIKTIEYVSDLILGKRITSYFVYWVSFGQLFRCEYLKHWKEMY